MSFFFSSSLGSERFGLFLTICSLEAWHGRIEMNWYGLKNAGPRPHEIRAALYRGSDFLEAVPVNQGSFYVSLHKAPYPMQESIGYPTNIASVNSVMGCSKGFFSLFQHLPWRTNTM